MVWFKDELIRESATVLSPESLRLTGAKANHKRFRDALRRDGNPVESGDRCRVGVIQAGVGRGIASAVLTLGAEDTLTLDTSKVLQSTAGAALPTFSSQGNAADCYITNGVDDLLDVDEDGNLINPEVVRRTTVPEVISGGFDSELGTEDKEGVFALGLSTAFDELAGFFGYDINSSAVADGEDIFENIHTSTGRIRRLSIKPWPTFRNNNIPAGNVLSVIDASAPERVRIVKVWSDDGLHRGLAFVTGDAADPQVDVIYEYGDVLFELNGTDVRVRNTNAAALDFNFIRPVVG